MTDNFSQVDVKEYQDGICPACGSEAIRLLDENFDQDYLLSFDCRSCKAQWTVLYTLNSVCLHTPNKA